MKLRLLTGDKSDNPEVMIPPAKITFIQRAINYYADLVGTLVGIALLIIVLVAWIAIGPAFKFNQNWWLIIGTYAGLIGLHDSFVLRNIQAKFCEHEAPEYADIDATNLNLLQSLNIAAPVSVSIKSTAISHRLSERVNRICGHQNAVIFGILFIVRLLVGASMLRWTETGQLLCNFPPSILESFLIIVLISGDNSADAQRRSDITNIFEHRRLLLAYVETVQEMTQSSVPNKSPF